MKEIKDPGIGVRYAQKSKRIINRDGSFNVVRRGQDSANKAFYHWLLTTSWNRFFVFTSLSLLGLYLLFAVFYYMAGVEGIAGVELGAPWENFASAVFFSIQTATTVGYGALYPESFSVNVIASIEALVGLLTSALATGMLFARFSRPTSRLAFSKNALLSPYRDTDLSSLQFRIVNRRPNVMMEMEAYVTFTIERLEEDGVYHRHYYQLPLEIDRIRYLSLNWTIVHIIDEDSPLWSLTKADFEEGEAELLVHIKGYDDIYGQTLHTRFSYHVSDFKWGHKFRRPCHINDHGQFEIHLKDIHAVEPISRVIDG